MKQSNVNDHLFTFKKISVHFCSDWIVQVSDYLLKSLTRSLHLCRGALALQNHSCMISSGYTDSTDLLSEARHATIAPAGCHDGYSVYLHQCWQDFAFCFTFRAIQTFADCLKYVLVFITPRRAFHEQMCIPINTILIISVYLTGNELLLITENIIHHTPWCSSKLGCCLGGTKVGIVTLVRYWPYSWYSPSHGCFNRSQIFSEMCLAEHVSVQPPWVTLRQSPRPKGGKGVGRLIVRIFTSSLVYGNLRNVFLAYT